MKRGEGVHIIGAEAICAAGATLDDCMQSMLDGQGEPGPPDFFQNELADTFPVFKVKGHHLTNNDPNITRTANLMLTAVGNAMEGAGAWELPLSTLRIGICIGTSVGASLNFLDFYRDWKAGETPDLGPIHRYLESNPADVVAEHCNVSGPRQTVVNACTSGADAIGIGAAWIRHGICDLVIAGGADELSEISYNGFASLQITSPDSCRPFDANRAGLNLGEGAGVLILASQQIIESFKTPSRGQIVGYGTHGDAYHQTKPHPKALGLKSAMDTAFAQAAIGRSDVSFINVHGTGTTANDLVEGLILREQFPDTPFSATKGFTGHTLGAAGAIEAAFTLASLERGELPPSQGFSETDPDIDRAPVTQRTTISGDFALSQSLAFGGNNSVLMIKRGNA